MVYVFNATPHKKEFEVLRRELRKGRTLSEALLWREIKNQKLNGVQFHRQVLFCDYILDFFCDEHMLAIEIDGEHSDNTKTPKIEVIRQKKLKALGITLLRFNDLDVTHNLEFVLHTIMDQIIRNGTRTPRAPHLF